MLRWSWSTAEVEFILGELGLAGLLPPFELPYPHTDPDAHAEFARATRERLRSSGVLERDGRWEPDIEFLVRLFTGYQAEAVVTVTGTLEERAPLRARGTRNRNIGVTGRLDGERVSFTELNRDDLVAGIVDLLPSAPAGQGESLTVPLGTQDESDSDGDDLFDTGRRRGPDPSEAARELLSQPKLAYGQFDLETAGTNGKRRSLGQLGWFDTPDGRWMSRQRYSGAHAYVEFSPADKQTLARRITQALATDGT